MLKASPETVATTIQALRHQEVMPAHTAQSFIRNVRGEFNEIEAFLVEDGEYFVERYLYGTYTYGTMEEDDVNNLHWYLASGLPLLMDPVTTVNVTGVLPTRLPLGYNEPVRAVVLRERWNEQVNEADQWFDWVVVNDGKYAEWLSAASAWTWLKEYGDREACHYHLVKRDHVMNVPILKGVLYELPELQ